MPKYVRLQYVVFINIQARLQMRTYQNVAASALVSVSLQSSHDVSPVALEKRPALQSTHVSLLEWCRLPALQGLQ